jgi:hypothetical protein
VTYVAFRRRALRANRPVCISTCIRRRAQAPLRRERASRAPLRSVGRQDVAGAGVITVHPERAGRRNRGGSNRAFSNAPVGGRLKSYEYRRWTRPECAKKGSARKRAEPAGHRAHIEISDLGHKENRGVTGIHFALVVKRGGIGLRSEQFRAVNVLT